MRRSPRPTQRCPDCGEADERADDIVHDLDCPTWDYVDIYGDWVAELEAFGFDMSAEPDTTHDNCKHHRGWKAKSVCVSRKRARAKRDEEGL